MSRIPGFIPVDRALKQTKRQVQETLKSVNGLAAAFLKKGDYERAQALVDVARQIGDYQREVDALRLRWREVLGRKTRGSQKRASVRLWQYYGPLLQALCNLGGDASTDQVISATEPLLRPFLTESDFESSSRGKPRWQLMALRSKRLMDKEGFLKSNTGRRWVITQAGREAAKKAQH